MRRVSEGAPERGGSGRGEREGRRSPTATYSSLEACRDGRLQRGISSGSRSLGQRGKESRGRDSWALNRHDQLAEGARVWGQIGSNGWAASCRDGGL
jgi:hypothetical protein